VAGRSLVAQYGDEPDCPAHPKLIARKVFQIEDIQSVGNLGLAVDQRFCFLNDVFLGRRILRGRNFFLRANTVRRIEPAASF
jgi:hypothetical protein